MDPENMSDKALVVELRMCSNGGDCCRACHFRDVGAICFNSMALAAADRIEKLSKRLTETAGIAFRLQAKLDAALEDLSLRRGCATCIHPGGECYEPSADMECANWQWRGPIKRTLEGVYSP